MSYPSAYDPLEGVSLTLRSKLFTLDQVSNKWVDLGLGYPKIIQRNEGSEYVLKFYHEASKNELIEEILSKELIIECPSDKQITISNDISKEDIALSFQNEVGRQTLWKHIKDALSNLNYLEQEREFNSFKKNFEHKEERGHCILPLPNVFNLELFLALLQETPLEDRNVISSELTVRKKKIFRAFNEVFKSLEESNNLPALRTLSAIFKQIIFYSEIELLHLLLSTENYMLTFGILEYDEQIYKKVTETHRDFFKKRVKYHEVAVFKDPVKLEEVHFNFRLAYLRDSALAYILDDSNLSLINLMSQRTNRGLVQYIISNREIMGQLATALSERDYNALCSIHDMFSQAKNQEIFLEAQADIYESFNEVLIFDILDGFLRNYDKPAQSGLVGYGIIRKKQPNLNEKQLERIPQMIVQILVSYMANRPHLLLKFMSSNEQKFQNYSFFQLVSSLFFNLKNPANLLYVSDLLGLILESSVKEMEFQPFLEHFFKTIVQELMKTFFDADYSEEKNTQRVLFIEKLGILVREAHMIPESFIAELAAMPEKLIRIFNSRQKCVISACLTLFAGFIETQKEQFCRCIGSILPDIAKYATQHLRNKGNLMYSETIQLFKLASETPYLTSCIQELEQKAAVQTSLPQKMILSRFIKDIMVNSITFNAKLSNKQTNSSKSLFNSETVKMSLNTHKRPESMLGADELDIDLIRQDSIQSSNNSSGISSKNRNSKFSSSLPAMQPCSQMQQQSQQLPQQHLMQNQSSVEQLLQQEDSPEARDILRKKLKTSM